MAVENKVTQLSLEVLETGEPVETRVTQIVDEVLLQNSDGEIENIVTQVVLEVAKAPPAAEVVICATQILLEVLIANIEDSVLSHMFVTTGGPAVGPRKTASC